jgi:hypothetical protein
MRKAEKIKVFRSETYSGAVAACEFTRAVMAYEFTERLNAFKSPNRGCDVSPFIPHPSSFILH